MKSILEEGIRDFKADFKSGNWQRQIANILTSLRILAPFVLIPLICFDKLNIFIIMVIFFFLTDTFDGYFARKYKSVSKFGAYLDAVVDKVFAISLLIPILIQTSLNNTNFRLVIINIILEVVIGLLNLYAFSKNLRPASTKIGKIKTVFLFVLLGILYLSKVINISNIYLFIFIILTIILQIITIFSYLSQIKKRKITINSSL